jgi:hypothetical protein
MTIYVLRVSGQIRGMFTDESRCYDIVDGLLKCGQEDFEVSPVEANRFYEQETCPL